MATEKIVFGKNVFTTVDGKVASATERKMLKKNIAIAKASAKVSDNTENALRLATYLCGKSDDVTLWQFIGANPVVKMRKTSVNDPVGDDNPNDFITSEKDVASVVLPLWFDSIAKEYSTIRETIARYFRIPLYGSRNTDVVSTSKCYETMYEMAKMMGLSFSKPAFRAFETSVNRLKVDAFGNGKVTMTNLDKAIMTALRVTDESINKHDEKLIKKYL